jgi:hypothetical protein
LRIFAFGLQTDDEEHDGSDGEDDADDDRDGFEGTTAEVAIL